MQEAHLLAAYFFCFLAHRLRFKKAKHFRAQSLLSSWPVQGKHEISTVLGCRVFVLATKGGARQLLVSRKSARDKHILRLTRAMLSPHCWISAYF